MGAAEHVTLVKPEEATVNVFRPVLVTVKVVPLMDVLPPLNVPPITPLRVTPVVAPSGKPCAATVVTVQGVPMATDAIWKTWVVVTGRLKLVASMTVALMPTLIAALNFPERPVGHTVFVDVKP